MRSTKLFGYKILRVGKLILCLSIHLGHLCDLRIFFDNIWLHIIKSSLSLSTVKPVLSSHSKEDQNKAFSRPKIA